MILPTLDNCLSLQEREWAFECIDYINDHIAIMEDGHAYITLADDPTDFGGMWLVDAIENDWQIELRPEMEKDDFQQTLLHELTHILQDIEHVERCEIQAETLGVSFYIHMTQSL